MTELVMRDEYADSTLFLQPSAGVGDETEKIISFFRQAAEQIQGESSIIGTWADVRAKLHKEISDPVLLENTLLFADAMPYWVPCPEIDVYEDDLEVVFEWFSDNYKIVNAVVNASGYLFYSGLLGKEVRRSGKDAVIYGIPQGLISAIKRISAAR